MHIYQQGETFECSGKCGKSLVVTHDRKWYAKSIGDKIVSGICPDCISKKDKGTL